MAKENAEKEKGIVGVAKSVLSEMGSMLNKKAECVVSINPDKDGWKVVIEVLERKAMPDSMDLLGRYEIKTNQDGEIQNYNQILLRHRNDALET